jgi:isocitrate/isopropylmalate dehydrogenase
MVRAVYDVVMLPGDGVGAEVGAEAERVLARVAKDTDTELKVDKIPCGGRYYLEHGTDWPAGSEARCKEADLILLGAVGWPSPDGPGPVTMKNGKMAGYSAVIGNRTKLDLFANVRPVKLFEGVGHTISGETTQVWKPENVDMVFLRENTEGLYVGSGSILAPGGVSQVGTDTRIITRRASERIIRMAYETAMKRDGAPGDKKRRVTCVVKNNVLFGCRLFADIFAEIGAEYPDVEQDIAIIDAFTQWLITRPEHYDVIVTTNMFGDIITDLAAVLQGGMGMAVGCNIGADNGMFEPIHGSAPDIAGQNKANPIAMILATAEGVIWLGQRKGDERLVASGRKIEAAVRAVLKEAKVLPADLAGDAPAATTKAVTDAILLAM